MPKSTITHYYAVRRGRNGPQVYEKWADAKWATEGFSGSCHKKFLSREAADDWLNSGTSASVPAVLPPEVYRNILNLGESAPAPVPSASTESTSAPEWVSSTSPKVELSDEQQHIVNLVLQGENVFFTGSAGTGKSVCLREIIRTLRERHPGGVYITASTGMAAVNIGGTTLHSYAGVGLGQEAGYVLAKKASQNPNTRSRWKDTAVLIIDEISMIDGKLFDKIEEVARFVRGNQAAFGGIQLVISGDFFQLPPVPDTVDNKKVPATFAFDARSWESCVGKNMVSLTKVFRQKDQTFINILNDMRLGKVEPSTIKLFKSLSRKVTYQDGLEPTQLYSKRNEVEAANAERLSQIKDETIITFNARDFCGYAADGARTDAERASKMCDQTLAPRVVTLKAGAQVMLIKNMPGSILVNGSLGRVMAFKTTSEARQEHIQVAQQENVPNRQLNSTPEYRWPFVKFANGQELLVQPNLFEVMNGNGTMEAARDQIPLILAWALSIHKSQGQTLDRLKIDLGGTFEKGQAYVALSRATSLERLEVLNFQAWRVKAHERVVTWSKSLRQYQMPVPPPAAMEKDPWADYDDGVDFDLNEVPSQDWPY